MIFTRALLCLVWGLTLNAAPCDNFAVKWKYLNLGTWSNEDGKLTWGQGVSLSLQPAGASEIQWNVPQRTIRDYDERIQDNLIPAADLPNGFQRFFYDTHHLKAASISVYFVRDSAASPSAPRAVTVTFLPGGSATPCQLQTSFTLSPAPRPVELYTSDHACGNALNPHMGRVIEDHFVWHAFHQFSEKIHMHPSFLHWHHLFLNRYESWRLMFGYPPVSTIAASGDFTQEELYSGHLSCSSLKFPEYPIWHVPAPPTEPFSDWEASIVTNHNGIHLKLIQTCLSQQFGSFLGVSSPKNELFWRFHKALDEIHYKPNCIENKKFASCPTTGQI